MDIPFNDQLRDKLRELKDLKSSLSKRSLTIFSDLDPAIAIIFYDGWSAIPFERRREIVGAMQTLAEDNVDLDFRQFFLFCLDDVEEHIRTIAVDSLWEDERPATMRRLIKLIDDPVTEVRVTAVISLSRFAYLAEIEGLSESAAQDVCTALLDTAADNKQPLEVRRRAVEALGYFASSPQAQDEITRIYEHSDPVVRESALIAMGRSMLPQWIPYIERDLRNPAPALRYEAARAVGEFAEEGESMLPALLPLVNDTDNEVALAAIWALGQVGGPDAQRVLETISESQDEVRAEAASEALDELMLGDEF
jgi:HEAT repeat protein